MLIEYLCNQFYTNTYLSKLSQKAVLWIRIRSDPRHFAGSGWHRHPGHADTDSAKPDLFQFQANETVDKLNFFQEKLQYSV